MKINFFSNNNIGYYHDPSLPDPIHELNVLGEQRGFSTIYRSIDPSQRYGGRGGAHSRYVNTSLSLCSNHNKAT